MFSASSMTFLSAPITSNSATSAPLLVITNATGPAAALTVVGEQPASLTPTATLPPLAAGPAPPWQAATVRATRAPMARRAGDVKVGTPDWAGSTGGTGPWWTLRL